MPNTIDNRSNHASVSMGNKMFVIGGYYTSTCEIFDSYSTKFTHIKSMNIQNYHFYYEAVCTGQTIVLFLMEQAKPCGNYLFMMSAKINGQKINVVF